MSSPPLPQPDHDSAPWWEGLDRHELLMQACGRCGRLRWPPRSLCNVCGSPDVTWVPVSGRGAVVSWTVTHRAPPGVATPYVVVLVRIEEQEDLFLPGYCDAPSDGSGLVIGAPVAVGFETVEEGAALGTVLRWRLLDR